MPLVASASLLQGCKRHPAFFVRDNILHTCVGAHPI